MKRREMLKLTGAAAVVAAAPRVGKVYGYPANETIRVGCIGTGGRCRQLMKPLASIQNVRITAVCDVFDWSLGEGRKLADPQALATKDYRPLLDRKDIDAVLIGTPDHWHAPMTVDACNAGKDVYVEKPLTHKKSEGPAVIEAQNRSRRIVQVGTQQRSMPHIHKACELIKSGRLGKVHKVRMTWNRNIQRDEPRHTGLDPKSLEWKAFLGNAKDQPFDEYRFRHWRWFWDFGGGIFTDLMVHWLDMVHWMLELDHPAEAHSIGDNFLWQDLWETPDTVQTLMRYPERQLQVHFEGTFVNHRQRAMTEIMGREATLYIDRGRYELHPEGNKGEYEELVLAEKDRPRGADFYATPDGDALHLANWVECMRSRNKPSAPAEDGVSSSNAAHLANQALRTGQVARWT
jgi:predicted dehydrogenase